MTRYLGLSQTATEKLQNEPPPRRESRQSVESAIDNPFEGAVVNHRTSFAGRDSRRPGVVETGNGCVEFSDCRNPASAVDILKGEVVVCQSCLPAPRKRDASAASLNNIQDSHHGCQRFFVSLSLRKH